MKRKLFNILVILLIPMSMMAQGQGRHFDEMLEKYKAEKIAFLSDKLDLSVQQAEKFWPVYSEHQQKKEKLMKEGRPSVRRPDPKTLSKDQMEEFMDSKIQNDLKMAKLAQDYHKKYKSLLPVEKVFILYESEREFMSQMLRKMRGQNREGNQRVRKDVPSQDGR